MRQSILGSLALSLFCACSGTSPTTPAAISPPSGGAVDPGCAGITCAYAGSGFVVHEWGTNTFVVGTDGSTLRGLHHEQEDLPSFVYDRIKAGDLGSISIEAKMETPVTYFYSDKPLTAQVKVDFPEGVLTQWYPAVKSTGPAITYGTMTKYVDPLVVPQCIAHGVQAKGGFLDWGSVQVLPRGMSVDVPDAPLDTFTWSHARAVSANSVRVTNPGGESGQNERFLFYRGLGNFPPPATVSWDGGAKIQASDDVTSIFVLDVGIETAGFVRIADRLKAGESMSHALPARLPMSQYLDALGVEVVKALDQSGLFHDESMAMVNTWRRQWFKTPGVRVLYLASPAWIDRKIPLTIVPAPDVIKRTMVIREELLTPEIEALDAKHAQDFATDPSSAKSWFDALGRFAEPRLRRALTVVNMLPPAAEQYLADISRMNTSAGVGE
jgi:hypothetical protein